MNIDQKNEDENLNVSSLIITFILFLLFTMIWGMKIIETNYKLLYVCCSCFILMIVFKLKLSSCDICIKRLLLLEAISIVMIVDGLILKVSGSIAEGLILGILIPLIGKVVYEEKKFIFIIENSARAILLSFWLMVLLSVLTAPYGNIQYRGVLINANSFAMFMLSAFCLFLYQVIDCNFNSKKFWRYGISTGLCNGFIVVSESRSALFSLILSIIILTLFYLCKDRSGIKNYFHKIIIIAILSIISVFAIMFITTNVTGRILDFEKSNFESEFIIYNYQSGSEKYKSEDTLDSKLENRILETTTSGRIDLWKIHAKEIGLIGHNEPIFFHNQTRTAHNTYIQLAYSEGFLCGVLLLIFNIIIGASSFVRLLRAKKPSLLIILQFIVILVYGIYSVVETIYSPYTQQLSLLFWVCSSRLLFKRNE